ncbi:acyl-CoA dehydrogenase family protein [Pseudothauera nasutitermitis]|uniref:acyl-CoA dehydrogenase family protein n=1 Tax=Pseudothauera nasutitermitis TaxID=2565930 RepID=UPI001E64736C|nr:acyl-CoA dehydrogenase family protein [Pseudothauera nasutitermitis]
MILETSPSPGLAEGHTEPAPFEPLRVARELARRFAENAVERDRLGGTPKAERDALRDSGLLRMSIPRAYGGYGANWQETLEVVRVLARVDGSIAHLFSFQHLMLATVRLFSRPDQWEPWYEHTARRNWFWGNALNPLDERLVATPQDGWHEFSGIKSFCSGALDSEMLIVSARSRDTSAMLIAALPTQRSGVKTLQDWDNIGQRQTDSGSVTFEKVRVEDDEILADPGPLSSPFACLRPLIGQLCLIAIYLGIVEGAFDEARRYTRTEARPWFRSGVERVEHDPYVLLRYGEFWLALESGRALFERAVDALDAAWRKGEALDHAERGELALAIAAAKAVVSRGGLDLCTRMFEVAGARATHSALALDRYWRNLRTHTLHDPLDYKLREMGEWALVGTYPEPSFYS